MKTEQLYICTSPWARNNAGDIIDKWLLNRYPPEVRNNFKLYVPDSPPVAESTTVKADAVSLNAKRNVPTPIVPKNIDTA